MIVWSGQGAKRQIGDVTDGTVEHHPGGREVPAAEPPRVGRRRQRAVEQRRLGRVRHPLPLPAASPTPTRRIIVVGQPSDPAANTWRRYFGSSHTGGMNAVFGDGSVRFVRFNVDPVAFMRACVVDDGQPSTLPTRLTSGGIAMRTVLLIAGSLGFALALAGCGSKTVINTAPMTDEQKQKVAAEDERVADEESGGHAGKAKKGGQARAALAHRGRSPRGPRPR